MSSGCRPDHRPITEARLLAMVNTSGDSFWESDVERRFVHVSDNMCRTMGYPREELLGRSVLEFMTPEYRAEIIRLATARGPADNPVASASPLRHEGEFFRKDGSRLWVETVSVPVFDEAGLHLGFFGITRDTTLRKRAEQELRQANQRLEAQLHHIRQLHEQLRVQNLRDDLTGVHNRRHFVAVAEDEVERSNRLGTPLALIIMDIDHFKRVNDEHGHPVGDLALKAVGALLNAMTRGDDLACRLGGEEFAVLLPGMEHEDAVARARQWQTTLAALSIDTDGGVLHLTASFGVASQPRQGGSLAELMKAADARLYRAKALGRNQVVGSATCVRQAA